MLQSPADIPGFDLIHVVGYDDDWHRWYATYQSPDEAAPNGLSVDSFLFAIDAALRGDGIRLGRRPFIDSHLKSGRLVEVFGQPFTLQTTCFMRVQTGTPTSRCIRQVAVWIGQLAGKPVSG